MPRPRRTHARPDAARSALSEHVRERRLELGITQAELADLAGLSRTTVYLVESGATTVGFAAVVAIADVLGCDVRLAPRIAA